MKWFDRLLGRRTPDVIEERKKDEKALRDLHVSFDKVQARTDRLEKELRRVNDALRARQRQQRQPR